SPVDHLRVGEGELRTRINRDDHAGHTAELLVRQKSCSFLAVDGDGYRGSIAAKRIARVEQTAIIATRAGDKPGGSGSRFLTVVPEGRDGPDTSLDVRISAADDDLNLVRLRCTEDIFSSLILLSLEKLEAEDLECLGGRGHRQQDRRHRGGNEI